MVGGMQANAETSRSSARARAATTMSIYKDTVGARVAVLEDSSESDPPLPSDEEDSDDPPLPSGSYNCHLEIYFYSDLYIFFIKNL